MRESSRTRTRGIIAALLLAAGLRTSPGSADEITVKGTVLRGKVVELTAGGIEFRTEYGAGNIVIPYSDVEALTTAGRHVVVHGRRGLSEGYLLGVEDGRLLVGEDRETADRVDVRTIIESDTEDEAASFLERIRSKFRFWSAEVHAGVVFEESTKDEFDIAIGGKIERRREPTRLLSQVNFIYGTDRAKGESSVKSDNEVRVLLKGEYDLSERLFAYTSHDYEYDQIDRLSARWVGKIGPGYRIFREQNLGLQVETGIAYNYERYFGGSVEEFAAVPFGLEGRIGMVRGSVVEFRGDYLPSLQDWTGDYLFRGELALRVPIHKYLALRFALFEAYDSTPDESSSKNTVKTSLSLSWQF